MNPMTTYILTWCGYMHAPPITQVVFKVNQGAMSPLVFGASVWKNGVKLRDAAPVTVCACWLSYMRVCGMNVHGS